MEAQESVVLTVAASKKILWKSEVQVKAILCGKHAARTFGGWREMCQC